MQQPFPGLVGDPTVNFSLLEEFTGGDAEQRNLYRLTC